MGAYQKAMDTYTVEEFGDYMSEISQRYPRMAEYLDHQVGFEKWSRCHFLGVRYNITTTNIVESLNSILVNAREFLTQCYSRKNVQVVEQEAGNGCEFDFPVHTKTGK